MKICIVTPTLSGGGAQKVAVNLANEWAQKGLKVELLVLRNTGVYFDQVSNKVCINVLGIKRIRFALLPLWLQLTKSKPDVVLSVIRDTNLYIGILSKFFPATRFFGREANTMDGVLRKKTMGKYFYLNMMRYLYKNIDGIIANSSFTYQDLLDHGIKPMNSCICGNPVIDKKACKLIREDVDDDWLRSEAYKVVISIGRLSKQKNHENLIKAFANVYSQNNEVRLIIIGSGNEKNALEAHILKNKLNDVVKIIPFQKNIYKYLSKASVFVLPSLYEGFGNVIVEALFCGVEVVLTNCPGGAVEIIKNGELGTIVENNNIDSLARGIETVLKNKQVNRGAALKARANDFNVTNVASLYLEFMTN